MAQNKPWEPPIEDETNRVFYEVFISAFERFVKNDLPSSLCSDWFYRCVHTRFGFNSSIERSEFIKQYFTCLNDKIRFVENILSWNEKGLPMTQIDIKLVSILLEWDILGRLQRKMQRETK
jgi:hypothetical protein